jgi:hypothetical protein
MLYDGVNKRILGAQRFGLQREGFTTRYMGFLIDAKAEKDNGTGKKAQAVVFPMLSPSLCCFLRRSNRFGF